MSAHSFPSLTSDASSIRSKSSDIHEAQSDRHFQLISSVPSLPYAPFKDPETTVEIVQIQNKVFKLEQDKIALSDYTAELQSHIRHLEQERMDKCDAINHNMILTSKEPTQANSRCIVHRTSTPPRHTNFSSVVHPPTLIPAATSTTARTVVTQLGSPHSTPTFNLPSSRTTRSVNPEAVKPSIQVPPYSNDLTRNMPYLTLAPRRRLQAICGMQSLDAKSSMSGEVSRPRCDRHDTPAFDSTPLHHRAGRYDLVSDANRPVSQPELDSVVSTPNPLTMSSSYEKAPLGSVATGNRSEPEHAANIPPANALPSSSPLQRSIFLDSPPKRRPKIEVSKKRDKPLYRSLGLEESRYCDVQPTREESKTRSRTRVSFSERPLPSPLNPKDDLQGNTGFPNSLWNSWGRKKHFLPLPSSPGMDVRPDKSSSIPSLASRCSQHLQQTRDDGKGYEKRRSIAVGCLRSILGSTDHDKQSRAKLHEGSKLRRSCSESRHSRSRSQSPQQDHDHDHRPAILRRPSAKDNEKARITPSRVGSPKLKAPTSEFHCTGEELERTNSLRSAGKWGQRGRIFACDISKRRTLHPMFSFERPVSAGASASSSRHADGEVTISRHTVESGLHARTEEFAGHVRREVQIDSGDRHQDDSGAPALAVLRSDSVSTHRSKAPMMHTRIGVQAHGTFAFEPAATVVIPPRSAPPSGSFSMGRSEARVQDSHDRAYLEFCDDLKAALGDGNDWIVFKKYIRRYGIETMTTGLLLWRVKKLIDCAQFANENMKLNLYERFVSIVENNG